MKVVRYRAGIVQGLGTAHNCNPEQQYPAQRSCGDPHPYDEPGREGKFRYVTKRKENLKMKKTIILVLTLVFALTLLAACGGDSGSNAPGGTPNNAGGGSSAPASVNSGGESAPPAAPETPAIKDGEKDTSSPAGETKEKIKPSELISLEDAERILGIEMKVYGELDKLEQGAFGGDTYKTSYSFAGETKATAYMLQVSAASPLSSSLDEIKKRNEGSKDLWVEDVGDWAMVVRSPLHRIEVVYKGYSFSLILTGNHAIRDNEEESAWKAEMLIEAGKCGVEHLEAIIK